MGLLSRENEVERLARRAGWAYLKREGNTHFLAPGDHRRRQYVVVKHVKGYDNSVFQSFLPVRFPLDRPPSGLFGRVLLRSHELMFSSWEMVISDSCEASLYVAASVPYRSVDAALLGLICDELVGEVGSFSKELRDKFAYTIGAGVVNPAGPRATGTAIVSQSPKPPVRRER